MNISLKQLLSAVLILGGAYVLLSAGLTTNIAQEYDTEDPFTDKNSDRTWEIREDTNGDPILVDPTDGTIRVKGRGILTLNDPTLTPESQIDLFDNTDAYTQTTTVKIEHVDSSEPGIPKSIYKSHIVVETNVVENKASGTIEYHNYINNRNINKFEELNDLPLKAPVLERTDLSTPCNGCVVDQDRKQVDFYLEDNTLYLEPKEGESELKSYDNTIDFTETTNNIMLPHVHMNELYGITGIAQGCDTPTVANHTYNGDEDYCIYEDSPYSYNTNDTQELRQYRLKMDSDPRIDSKEQQVYRDGMTVTSGLGELGDLPALTDDNVESIDVYRNEHTGHVHEIRIAYTIPDDNGINRNYVVLYEYDNINDRTQYESIPPQYQK